MTNIPGRWEEVHAAARSAQLTELWHKGVDPRLQSVEEGEQRLLIRTERTVSGHTVPMAWLVARTTASHAARVAAGILHDDPAALSDAWRFAILQLLDDYNAAYRQHGSQAAADLFTTPPAASGDRRIDAALAALAEHLARRDGWRPPAWAFDPERYAEPWWFVAGLTSLHAMALVQSPAAFRKRGVFITDGDLDRV